MSDRLYTGMSWLPPAPADFNRQCKDLAAEAAIGDRICALAGHALDENKLSKLGRAIMRAQADRRSLAPLQPFRLGILGNGTTDLLVPALVASAARHGIALECLQGDYGQTTQEALSAHGRINLARPDAVLLAIDHRGLPLRLHAGSLADEQGDVERALAGLAEMREGVHAHAGAPCIVQTLAPPPERLFGSMDRLVPGTARRVIEALNSAISDSIAATGDVLLDVGGIAETVGLGAWHSPSQWNAAKLPFAEICLPLYADHVARLLAARQGKSRRCLILDLDNTVWGGVVADDGLEGIKIAQGDPTGEAHLSVQHMALALRRRGIVLAVSSKNDDEVAREPFRSHPEMLLKEEHIAVFRANWQDKATNIQIIAEQLSLGLDAMVFLDDNPFERNLVRQMLPQVAVPELPDDPALYTRTLAAAGYFETVTFSDEDRQRADMYQHNTQRTAMQKTAGDIDAYLASLDMEITFAPFDRTGRVRITQLINKSNQFNLTTRRYTEAEVTAAEEDSSVFTLQVRLADRFGDNGMISVVICRPDGLGAWDIDTWLMSCRVLGRKVEHIVLRELLLRARSAGVTKLIGRYCPTKRNSLVCDHYRKLGFAKTLEHEDGTTVWQLPVGAEIEVPPIRVRRCDLASAANVGL